MPSELKDLLAALPEDRAPKGPANSGDLFVFPVDPKRDPEPGQRTKVTLLLEVDFPGDHAPATAAQCVVSEIVERLQPSAQDFEDNPDFYYRFVGYSVAQEEPANLPTMRPLELE